MNKKTRLELMEERHPKRGAKIRAMLERKRAERENQGQGNETPSMSWNKTKLTEYAENMEPPIEVPASWTKQEILDAIEENV